MALIIQYDPSSTPVANQVTLIDPSGDTSQYSGQPNTLINPNVPGGVAMKFLKVDGPDVVEMSQGEKDSITAVETAAYIASTRTSSKSTLDDFGSPNLATQALALLVLNQVNILRGLWMAYKVEVAAATSLGDLQTRVAGMDDTPELTISQLKTAMKNQIDAMEP